MPTTYIKGDFVENIDTFEKYELLNVSPHGDEAYVECVQTGKNYAPTKGQRLTIKLDRVQLYMYRVPVVAVPPMLNTPVNYAVGDLVESINTGAILEVLKYYASTNTLQVKCIVVGNQYSANVGTIFAIDAAVVQRVQPGAVLPPPVTAKSVAYIKGDYVSVTQSQTIGEILHIGLSGLQIECVFQGIVPSHNHTYKVGEIFWEKPENVIPTSYNGAWNSQYKTSPTVLGLDLAKDDEEELSEEADPYGLIKQRRELRKFIYGV